MNPTLERRSQTDATTTVPLTPGAAVMLPPAVGDDYWSYRVRLTPTQAVLGFPKFDTIGIGFAVEEDTNTNLPYTCQTIDIVSHIWHNAYAADPDYHADPEAYDREREITIAGVYRAVELIQQAATADRPGLPAMNTQRV